MKIVDSLSALVSHVESHSRIFLQGAMCTPTLFINELVKQHERLRDVEIYHIHIEGEARYLLNEYSHSFRSMNLFVGGNVRPFLNYDTVDYIPCYLSELPRIFREKVIDLDIAVVQVSLPNKDGYCSMGPSVDTAFEALKSSKKVLALMNSSVPFILGDGVIHVDEIDFAVEVDTPLYYHGSSTITESREAIALNVASVISDGATLQVGIGAIPEAVLTKLSHHKHLGLHTELASDGAIALIKSGAIDNTKKKIDTGVSIASFLMGTKELIEFVHQREDLLLKSCEYVNNPYIVSQNPSVVSINSAIEVDLTGQVCADSIGPNLYSGVGGQVDFVRGATLSQHGKSIIALSSRSLKGVPKIVPMLKQGAGVVTSRYDVFYIATEFGIVNLKGLSLGKRAKALISIAHPDDRERLEREWHLLHSRC